MDSYFEENKKKGNNNSQIDWWVPEEDDSNSFTKKLKRVGCTQLRLEYIKCLQNYMTIEQKKVCSV